MNVENIQSFIEYRFSPLSISQLISRQLVSWALSIACIWLGEKNWWGILSFVIFDLLILCVGIYIAKNGLQKKNSKFLWDGMTLLYLSICLNVIAYHILARNTAGSLLLALALFVLLLICLLFSGLLVCCSIKKNRYSEDAPASESSHVAYIFAVIGLLSAKICLSTITDQMGLQIVALILLLLSYILAFGWTNVIKLILNCKINNSH